MTSVLLLGAGFSRNWGGWLAAEVFEYLLGCDEVSSDDYLRSLLWTHQNTGGYEGALAALQAEHKLTARKEIANRLRALEAAIGRMFADMNNAFFEHRNLEFKPGEASRKIHAFLTRFDAIFTLNQDVLLEHCYLNRDLSSSVLRPWNLAQIPGMHRTPEALKEAPPNDWARAIWTPTPQSEFKVHSGAQPFFKLHGSSNWRDPRMGSMLIMGGNKAGDIAFYPILNWYAEQFENYLGKGDTRLMVIGYGFRDAHINLSISRAVEHRNLKMYLISPQGSELARLNHEIDHPSKIRPASSDLMKTFERCLIGASRRSLRDIFGGDIVEFNKVNRFFH